MFTIKKNNRECRKIIRKIGDQTFREERRVSFGKKVTNRINVTLL